MSTLLERFPHIPPHIFSWFEGKEFLGPDGLRGYGKYQLNAWKALDVVFQYTPGYGTILHAGGHIGIMSLALAQCFTRVITFEVAEDNYAWLTANIAHVPQIEAHYGALGNGAPVQVIRHKYSAEHHAQPGGDVPCFRIDDLAFTALDVLLLDLEGGELVALEHATETLCHCRPLAVIEEYSRWCRRYNRTLGDVTRLMESLGYHLVGTTEMDLAFVYG